MKKLVLTMLTLLSCGTASALPIGNPSEASTYLNGAWWDNNSCCDPCDPCFSWNESWGVRIGYYGDFVYNRNLRVSRNNTGLRRTLNETTITTNAGYLAVNFFNRIDLFTTLGNTNFNYKANGLAFSTVNSLIELNFKPRFSWSIGGRATLWQCDCFAVGIEGQYLQTKSELDHVIFYDVGNLLHFSGSDRFHRFREWQVGLGVSYRFATSCPTIAFIPYFGVKYSDVEHRVNSTFVNTAPLVPVTYDVGNLRPHRHWGYALGITLELCDMIGVTAEGRWGDERALYINWQFRL